MVPVLVLAVLPLCYFAGKLGLLSRARGWRIVMALSFVALASSLPYGGVDFAVLKRLDLLIAAAAALVLVGRRLGLGWLRERKRYLQSLAALAVASAVVYLNFFAFHGERTWVHYHDVAHYYLGSKYFREVGYSDLYIAMLRAEAELYDNHFKTIEARDLHSGDLVHIRGLLQTSGPVKAAFTPERWKAFTMDVAYFRDALGPQYGNLFQDHGYNPTPLWTLIGGGLANLVPAGSGRGIFFLTLIDPLLVSAAFAAVAWAFGLETLLIAISYFCVIFGASFGWTGGAFLRDLWFFGVVVGSAALAQRRHALAGALIALAAVLRVFPAFFVAGLFFKGVADVVTTGRVEAGRGRFLLAFAASGALLFSSTLVAFGASSWTAFCGNIDRHMQTVSPNIVGLSGILAYEARPAQVSGEELREIQDRRQRVYHWQLVSVFLLVLIGVAVASPFLDDLAAVALGVPLLFFGLNLASYYYAFLVILVLVNRRHPRRLALLFVAEALSYALILFEEREALLYVYRSLIVLYLLAALALERD